MLKKLLIFLFLTFSGLLIIGFVLFLSGRLSSAPGGITPLDSRLSSFSPSGNLALKSEEADFAASLPQAAEAPTQDRLVIQTASLSLLVKDVEKTVSQVKDRLLTLKGLTISSRVYFVDEKQSRLKADLTVKVPSADLENFLSQVRPLAEKVVSESLSGQDVTEEYVDQSARLKNLQASEAQLLEIMNRAGKVSEVLEVQRELSRVRGEIEALEGRLKYLKQSSDMASVSLYLATEEEELPLVEEKWRPLATAKNALRSLLNFSRGLADLAIWLAVFFLPLLAVILIVKKVIKKNRK